jgi:cytoskeletal protein CcmA (bactofilin family)
MANGQYIEIKGEISGAEDMVIAGRVEGTIRLENCTLTLAEGAQVHGDVVAGSVVVAGAVTGSLQATERIDVRHTATVEGEIETPVLGIAEGAQVSALVEMPERRAVELKLAV